MSADAPWRVDGSRILLALIAINVCAGALLVSRMSRPAAGPDTSMLQALGDMRDGWLSRPVSRLPRLVMFVRHNERLDVSWVCNQLTTSGATSMEWYLIHDESWAAPSGHCSMIAPKGIAISGSLRQRFGHRAEWGRWFLYDSSGSLQAQGALGEGGFVRQSELLVLGVSPSTDGALALLKASASTLNLAAHSAAGSGRDVALMLVNFASSQCGVGSTLAAFAGAPTRATRYVVIPRSWEPDAETELTRAFELDVRIVRPGDAFDNAWKLFADIYGHSAVNGMLLLVTSGSKGTTVGIGQAALDAYLRSVEG